MTATYLAVKKHFSKRHWSRKFSTAKAFLERLREICVNVPQRKFSVLHSHVNLILHNTVEIGRAPFRLHCQIAYSSTVHLPTILAVIKLLDFRLLDTLKFTYFKFDLCILVYMKSKFLKMVYCRN